jgi:Fe-S-cluster-containing dehydrogenase component
MITRRDFLKTTVKGIAGLWLPLAAIEIVDPKMLSAGKGPRWVFVVDTYKCVGCGLCVKACKTENDIPFNADVTRTWIERYVLRKDGKLFADTPKGSLAMNGFTSDRIDLGEEHGEEGFREIKSENIDKAFFVPKLCNQCANPPCVQVCPVGATYRTPDGVVLVDRKWCIGCGYCVMACPYGARFFHPVLNVADKCNFCYHRISNGMKTACVGACPFGARMIGNINDPGDPVTKIIMTERVGVVKSEFGTKPQVFYIGLDREVR